MEFGRLQARDLLQHLWTGPISNAPVNIVQGSKSVEVRPVGISKVRLIMLPDVGVAVLKCSRCSVTWWVVTRQLDASVFFVLHSVLSCIALTSKLWFSAS